MPMNYPLTSHTELIFVQYRVINISYYTLYNLF